MIRQQPAVAAVAVAQVAGHGSFGQTIGACCSANLCAGMLAGTVAILAQGTSWAVAVTQAFLPVDRTFRQDILDDFHVRSGRVQLHRNSCVIKA